MAKKQEPAPSQALENRKPASLDQQRPEFIKAGKAGTEHITKDDMKIPRLALAQALSPQLKRGDGAYIEGLQQGDAFNSLTKEIIPTPFAFHVVRADRPRYIEFWPRDSSAGKGIKDFDVKPNDPRTRWTTDGQGQRQKPLATMFYDYLIIPEWAFESDNLLDAMIGLSLKNSQIGPAKDLNGLMKLRGCDIFAGRYELRVIEEDKGKGAYFNVAFSNAGWAQSPAQLTALAQLFEDVKDRDLTKLDRDDAGQEDAEFTTEDGKKF